MGFLAKCFEKIYTVILSLYNAEVVELADTHGSEPCVRKDMRVQIPPSALVKLNRRNYKYV